MENARTNDDLRMVSHAIDDANAFVFSGELASTEMMMPIASNQEHQQPVQLGESMMNLLLDDVFPDFLGANAGWRVVEAQDSQRPVVARKTATDNARVTPGGRRLCSVPECLSHALEGGKCCKHGGGQSCTYPECNSIAIFDNKCALHGRKRDCSHPDCTRRALSKKDKCRVHGRVVGCSHPGCTKRGLFEGKCAAHGRRRACREEGCTRYSVAYGRCSQHGGKKKRAHPANLMMPMTSVQEEQQTEPSHPIVGPALDDDTKVLGGSDHEEAQGLTRPGEKTEVRLAAGTCSYQGCKRRARLNGKCTAHSKCSIPDCINLVVTRGKCGAHGGGSRCSEPGCTKRAHLKSKCSAHAERIPCSQEGCIRLAASRGRCRLHRAGKKCSQADPDGSGQARAMDRCDQQGARYANEVCRLQPEAKSFLQPKEALKFKVSQRFGLTVLTRIAQQKIKD